MLIVALAASVACASEIDEVPSSGSATPSVAGSSGTTGASSSAGSSGAAGYASTAGSGGIASAGSGGSSVAGAGGASGSAGTAGNGGSAGLTISGGSGGMAGASGTGGSAGGGSVPVTFSGTPGECAASPTMRVDYKYYDAGKAIHPAVNLVNTGASAVPLAEVELFYFFSQEETAWRNPTLFESATNNPSSAYSSLPGGTTSVGVGTLAEPLVDATHFVRIAFSANVSLQQDAWVQLNVNIEPASYDAPDQDQSNDYSFDSGHGSLAQWDKIAVYQDGTLVWGCVPDAT